VKAFFAFFLAFGSLCVRATPREPVPIIFDTDIGSDVDDAGAVAVLHALADSGKVRILAMGLSSDYRWGVPCLDALNTYYGRPDIPIGAVKSKGVKVRSRYAKQVSLRFPHDLKRSSEAPEACKLYRKILAAQPPKSVVFVSVGFITNLRDLLLSEPDDASPLTGIELVRRKVKAWISMSCGFPDGRYYNVRKDPQSAKEAIEKWPTPIYFTGAEIGKKILTGPALISTPSTNPVRLCYRLYNGLKPRPSWDQTAVLFAAECLCEKSCRFWDLSPPGRALIRRDGYNLWQPSAKNKGSCPHYYLIEKMSPARVAAYIESLMVMPPRGRLEEFGNIRFWLRNALTCHGFTIEETAAATRLSPEQVRRLARLFGIERAKASSRRKGRLVSVLPYPGGRHPRIGFLQGAVNPQRGTKVSIFLPWENAGYVVLDLPEALWTNLGLTFLAHKHIPTIWEKRNVELPPVEWRPGDGGSLVNELVMPNGIAFRGKVIPRKDAVDFTLEIKNGSGAPLSDIRAQVCLMLKGARGFREQTASNKSKMGNAALCRSSDGKRWIIIAWERGRVWWNPEVPCIHSDPKFPDAQGGETVRARGRLFFYKGQAVWDEIARRLRDGTLFSPPTSR